MVALVCQSLNYLPFLCSGVLAFVLPTYFVRKLDDDCGMV